MGLLVAQPSDKRRARDTCFDGSAFSLLLLMHVYVLCHGLLSVSSVLIDGHSVPYHLSHAYTSASDVGSISHKAICTAREKVLPESVVKLGGLLNLGVFLSSEILTKIIVKRTEHQNGRTTRCELYCLSGSSENRMAASS